MTPCHLGHLGLVQLCHHTVMLSCKQYWPLLKRRPCYDFAAVFASLYEAMSVSWSLRWSVGPSVMLLSTAYVSVRSTIAEGRVIDRSVLFSHFSFFLPFFVFYFFILLSFPASFVFALPQRFADWIFNFVLDMVEKFSLIVCIIFLMNPSASKALPFSRFP